METRHIRGERMHLRKMRPEEFSDYVAYFIPDYADEISSNYDVDIKTARERAKREVDESFGNGVETRGQTLLCVVADEIDSDSAVGYFWCSGNKDAQSIFISDFCILPPFRGRGFGASALAALEVYFSETEHGEIRLRVAADNKRAEHLYLRAGYTPTGINMRKAIKRS